MTTVERKRLVAILGMLGSEHDGERASAALQAEIFRKKHGLTWPDLLALSPTEAKVEPRSEQPNSQYQPPSEPPQTPAPVKPPTESDIFRREQETRRSRTGTGQSNEPKTPSYTPSHVWPSLAPKDLWATYDMPMKVWTIGIVIAVLIACSYIGGSRTAPIVQITPVDRSDCYTTEEMRTIRGGANRVSKPSCQSLGK